MRRIIVVALAVLGVCMAATASASAHLFHASNTGKLLGLSTNIHVFTPFSGGSAVECEHAAITGTVTALLSLHQLVTVTYNKCTAFFKIAKATITPAEYLLSADGLAAIVNTIFVNVEGVCTLTVKPQDLGTVKYKTDPSNSAALIEESEVEGIGSTGSGGKCGTNNTGGTYTGNTLIRLDGSPGTLSWL